MSGENLREGDEFAGHRIDGVLGEGGMGVVYSATHIGLDAPRALKVITPTLARQEEFRERFRREARLAASLQHQHVVTIHDTGEAGGVLYISMQRVDGRDLSRLIAERGRLDPREATELLGHIAEALDAAHGRGLVHRDVKPANVLVEDGPGGRAAYATDFGLTKPIASESGFTQTGMAVGSIDYMAPEQFSGAPLDARTDVYALGAVYFAALTGEVPFPADNPAQKMFGHTQGDAPSIRERVPELPTELDSVVAKSLAKDPEDRFQSAGDLARAARAAVAGGATQPMGSVAAGEAATGVVEIPAEEATTRIPAQVPPPPPRRPEEPTARVPAGGGGPQGRRWGLIAAGALAVVAAGVAVAFVVRQSPDGTPDQEKLTVSTPPQDESNADGAAKPANFELTSYSPSNQAYDYKADIPTGDGWEAPVEEEVTEGRLLRSTIQGPDGLVVSIDRTPSDPPSFGYDADSERTVSHPAFNIATEYVFSGNDAFDQCVDSTCIDIQVGDFSGGGWAVLAGGTPDFKEVQDVARQVADSLRT